MGDAHCNIGNKDDVVQEFLQNQFLCCHVEEKGE